MVTHTNISFGGYSQASGSHPWYGPLNAFDGYVDSFWQSNVPCNPSNYAWINYYWDTVTYKISKYKIRIGSSQFPISWILQSSVDGINWLDLDTQTISPLTEEGWLEYNVTLNQYYGYYRLLITDTSDRTLPVKIYDIEFQSLLSDITTSTTSSSSSSSTSTFTTVTSTTTTTRSTTSTRSTTTTYTTVTSTTTEDPNLLWKVHTKLNRVRDDINQWYEVGIPTGVKQVETLPTFSQDYLAIPVYVISEDKFYLGTETGWEQLNLGNIKHAPHHATTGDDELIHVGLDTPESAFPGKVWIYSDYTITTTSTTTTQTTQSTSTSLTSTTSTTTTTYTYTTTTLTTTTSTATSSSSITQANYTYNILWGCSVSSDTYELGYEPSKAIDNLDWTKWLTNSSDNQGVFPHWIKFVLDQPKIVYIINVLWDFGRYATNWTLEGSNEGYIWNKLFSLNSDYPPIPSVWNQYLFQNNAAYSQYRVRFLTGVDSRTNSVGLFGFQLLADAFITTSTTSTVTTSTSTLSSTTTLTTTASTTQLGYVNVALSSIVLAIDEYPDYNANNLIDNNENTYWICNPNVGPPYWTMFYWGDGSSFIVNQYKLYLSSLGRPRDWNFQGSNNGLNWTTLDSQENIETEGWWSNTISNVTAYKYYRVLITNIQSTGYAVRLGCVELWINEQYRTSTTSSTTTITTTITTSTSTTLSSSTQTSTVTTASTTYPIPTETTLLMNFNAPNLYTQSSDDTNRHHDIQWIGNAIIKTDSKKYGIGALYLPYESYYPVYIVDNSYLILPNSSDWVLGKGTQDFTIDFWFNLEADNNLSRNWNNFITYFQDINNYWSIRLYPIGNLFNFTYRRNGVLIVNYSVLCNINYNQWNHLLLVRLGNLFRFFINCEAYDDGQTYSSATFLPLDGDLWIGYGPSEYLNTTINYTQANCRLDSVRISTGALFDAPFEVPPEPTTSTTISTTTTVTTTTAAFLYAPRLSLRCDDGNSSYIQDYSGRHNAIAIGQAGATYANSFDISSSLSISPKFNQYLFSTFHDPYDYTSTDANYLVVDADEDWQLGDNGLNNFTIESWMVFRNSVYLDSIPVLSQYQDVNNFWALYINYANNRFLFKVRSDGNFIIDYSSNIIYDSTNWNYFALSRWNEKIRIFWNGQTSNYWVDYSNITIPSFSGPLYLFGGPSLTDLTSVVASGLACNGLRISAGIYPGTTQAVIPTIPF